MFHNHFASVPSRLLFNWSSEDRPASSLLGVDKPVTHVNSANKIQNGVIVNIFSENKKSLQSIERNFRISTKNGKYYFNQILLVETSKTIKKVVSKNPDCIEYHIELNDETNVMGKFENVYLGKTEKFSKSEKKVIRSITKELGIASFPSFMKPKDMRPNGLNGRIDINFPKKFDLFLNEDHLASFVKINFPSNFTIHTKNKSYTCKKIGVITSQVIRALIDDDTDLNEFHFDFDDDFDDFAIIAKYFNYENIIINNENMEIIHKFSEDLQIQYLLDQVCLFIDNYNKRMNKLEKNILFAEPVEELFHWLKNIKQNGVEKTKNSLMGSIWVYSESNVQELVACILQIIKIDMLIHPEIADLCVKLNQSKHYSNNLDIFIPFLVKKTMASFLSNSALASFAYILVKYDLLKMDYVIARILIKTSTNQVLEQNHQSLSSNLSLNKFLYSELWFVPEILAQLPHFFDKIQDSHDFFYIVKDKNNNFQKYKEMRNSRIPIDEIARAIRNDDVDTLQKIISQNSISLDGKIPNDIFNIYKNMTYIDYAAYYGALKCFKYLLLNKAKINTCTLAYSVASGNIEIIRNIKAIKQDVKPKAAPQGLRLATGAGLGLDIGAGAISPLSMAIAHHYNDIFDWLFEQEFADSKNDVKYDKIIISAAQNCNIHAIIKCIEHGLDISLIPNPTLQSFLFAIFSNGYFRLFQNLLYLYPNIMSFNSTPSQSNFYSPTVKSFLKFSSVRNTYLSNLVISGSLSFLKIYLHSVNSINNNMITTAFLDSAEQGYFDIFKFFFNELPNWKPTLAQIENAVVKALENMNYDIVLYLFNNSEYKPNHRVLDIACKSNKFEIVKIITNFILKQYPKSDFTSAFYIAALNGSFDICKFFAEKQVFLDFGILENKAQSIVKSGDKDILFLLMDIADPEEKELFLADCLDQAIQGGNKEIVEYILSQDVSIDNALFTATQLERLEIIKLIVEKNNSPSYINSISPEGTAISIAIQKKNLEIVKYFLSIPGINLDIYQKDHKTPLMVAAEMRDWEITNLIINFYGDKIHSQLWQVNESIKILLRKTHSRHIQRTQILSGNSLSQSFPRPGVSLLKKSISDYTIDEDLSIMKILNLFLKIKNVDINVIENGQTILSYACEKNHTELVNNLLKYKEIDVNQYLPDNGDTALMAAIREKSTETVEILLKLPNININHQNYQSETALTIAAEKSLIEIIKLLTSHKNFDPEINRLSYAFGNCLHLTNKDSANELIKTPNINVNKRIIIGKSILTPLVISVQKGFDDFVQLIIDHPTFDPVKSLTRTALFEAVQKDNANIFQLLLPFSPTSVNIKDKKNRTLLTVAARSSSQNIIPLIITNSDFDSQKSEIDVALTESYDKVPILNLLYELTNIDFTQTLPDGRTFLTAISYKNEKSLFALQFLLEKGADPNSMDLSGNLPLAMAIQAKNLLFISELINSEKIDLKLPLENNNSYLHLAAEQNVEIFQMIHQKNIIDINSVNDFGETSMFNAIRCRKKDIITFMFGIPEFDYQKLNFNNEDALDVASSLFSKKFDKMNYEKDAYLALLLKLIS